MGEGTLTRFVMLRTDGDPKAVQPDVRRVLRDLDPALPLSSVATLNELVEQTLAAPCSLTLFMAPWRELRSCPRSCGFTG